MRNIQNFDWNPTWKPSASNDDVKWKIVLTWKLCCGLNWARIWRAYRDDGYDCASFTTITLRNCCRIMFRICLFNDAFGVEVGTLWKGAVVSHVRVLSQHSPGGMRTPPNASDTITGLRTENWTRISKMQSRTSSAVIGDSSRAEDRCYVTHSKVAIEICLCVCLFVCLFVCFDGRPTSDADCVAFERK
jgi:hypothetical protein